MPSPKSVIASRRVVLLLLASAFLIAGVSALQVGHGVGSNKKPKSGVVTEIWVDPL